METLAAQLGVIGIGFTVIGLVAKRYPPKHPNPYYGYRLSSSKKSQARWDFAQRYYPQQMISFGLVSLVLALLSIPVQTSDTVSLVCVLTWIFISLLWMVIPTERAIRKEFGDED